MAMVEVAKLQADNEGDKYDTSSVTSLGPEEEIDTTCGCGPCRPSWLQFFNTPTGLLRVLCLYTLLEAFVEWGLVNIYLTTWERRYGLSSTSVAWVISAQDLSGGICGPIIGYLADFVHKGKIMTAGAVSMLMGYVLFLVPQFASEPYQLGAAPVAVCNPTLNVTCPDEESHMASQAGWLYVLILAQLMFGLTGATVFGVGLPYLDDNCKEEQLTLNAALMSMSGALGAVFGYIGGAWVLDLYVDFYRVDMDTINLTPVDPRWVGAWWISFAAGSILAVFVVLLVMGFPRKLPAAVEARKHRTDQAHNNKRKNKKRKMSFKDVLTATKDVFINPVFTLMTIGAVLESGGVVAMTAFLPKVLQFQFSQKPLVAALVTGVLLTPASALGEFLGGLIPRLMKLRVNGLMWEIIICQILSLIFGLGLYLRCPMPTIAGVNTPYETYRGGYPHLNETYDLWAPCNTPCNCTTYSYDPICGQDEKEYFSPCFAGCQTTHITEEGYDIYAWCSCIPGDPGDGPLPTVDWGWASRGSCGAGCNQYYYFLASFFVLTGLTFAQSMAGMAVTIRCVPDDLRSFAFGIQSPLIRFLGNVPAPILLGMFFDYACIVWQEACGETGSCWVYENRMLAIYLGSMALVIKIIALVCNLIAVSCYKDPEKGEVVEVVVGDGEVGAAEVKVQEVNGEAPTEDPHIPQVEVVEVVIGDREVGAAEVKVQEVNGEAQTEDSHSPPRYEDLASASPREDEHTYETLSDPELHPDSVTEDDGMDNDGLIVTAL